MPFQCRFSHGLGVDVPAKLCLSHFEVLQRGLVPGLGAILEAHLVSGGVTSAVNYDVLVMVVW